MFSPTHKIWGKKLKATTKRLRATNYSVGSKIFRGESNPIIIIYQIPSKLHENEGNRSDWEGGCPKFYYVNLSLIIGPKY